MSGSGAGLDALAEVRTDGQIVTDGILPAVVVGFEVRKSFAADIRRNQRHIPVKSNDINSILTVKRWAPDGRYNASVARQEGAHPKSRDP